MKFILTVIEGKIDVLNSPLQKITVKWKWNLNKLTIHAWHISISDDVTEAYNLIKDLEPTTPQEYILKGVVNAALGQESGSVSSLLLGNNIF